MLQFKDAVSTKWASTHKAQNSPHGIFFYGTFPRAFLATFVDYGLKKKMGGTKRQIEEYYSWLSEQEGSKRYLEAYWEEQAQQEEALYEEVQSRLRLSMTCKDLRRNPSYPLTNRIVDLSIICSVLKNELLCEMPFEMRLLQSYPSEREKSCVY